jgi:GTPase SAR1 family protein
MPTARLLLFGTPGAGKSSLLGALAQAAPALKAELTDASGELQQLQKNTYNATLQPTGQLESYEIKIKPDKGTDPFLGKLTVLDCSGKSALEMLRAKDPFANSQPMKKPILDADAVVLVVDASLSNKQLSDEFKQFAHWLKELHELRGRRTDIADLPVYFVLTKCDLLARKEDTAGAWIQRVEELKGKFAENFRKYLKQHAPGFGTIKLKLSATAIKSPAFTDRPAKEQGPFGVAELFRECLRSASDFQERRLISQGRLQNVVVGLIGIVALLALSVVFLGEFQPPDKGTTLDEKAQMALPKPTATPAERLQGTIKKLQNKQTKLTEIENDAHFASLPTEMQEAVTGYQKELAQFLKSNQEAQAILKLPYLAKNDAEFQELEKNELAFALPAERAKDWEETRLGHTMRHVRDEYKMLRTALQEEETWIRGQIEQDKKLLIAGNDINGRILKGEKDAPQEAKDWHKQYQTQITALPPTARADRVPGVSRILYEDLSKFEPVKKAQKDWETYKKRLTNLSALIQEDLKAN